MPASPGRIFAPAVLSWRRSTAIAVNEMQVSYGATERPLILQASGQARSWRGAALRPLARGAADRPRPHARRRNGSPGRHRPTRCRRCSAACRDVPMPAWPGALRLDAQSVVLGGGVVSEVAIDLATAGDAWLVRDFSALLPGETRVGLQGDARHPRRAELPRQGPRRVGAAGRARRLVARQGRLGGATRPLRRRRGLRSSARKPDARQPRGDDRRRHGDGRDRVAAFPGARPALRDGRSQRRPCRSRRGARAGGAACRAGRVVGRDRPDDACRSRRTR